MKYIALASAIALFAAGWWPVGWVALAWALWLHLALEENDGLRR